MSWAAFTAAAEADIGVNGARILLLAGESDGIRRGALAKSLDLKPSSVGPIVDRMEGMGLLVTVEGGDRRTRPVKATDRGMELRKKLLAA